MNSHLATLILTVAIAAPATALAHPDLAGFWEPRDHSESHKEEPSLTPAAIAKAKTQVSTMKDGVSYNSRNCLVTGQPWNLQQSAPIDIIQDARETTMIYESHSLPWHIYTDGRGHPDEAHLKLTVSGHSIGRWDGDTFVVDTVGFSGKSGPGAAPGVPTAATTHLVERFTMDPDGKVLRGHFTVDDPQTLTKPYSWDFIWFRSQPGTYAQDEICDARDAANQHY